MCNKIETTNGELPVEQLANGEGTVIMGYSNPHLSIRKAMGCPIARSYFVKAFAELNDDDKVGFIASTDLKDFAILTAMVVDDFQSIVAFAYFEADSADAAQDFITYVADKVVARIGETDEAHKAFAEELDQYYTEFWMPVIRADKAAERAEKLRSRGGNSEEADAVAALMALMGI